MRSREGLKEIILMRRNLVQKFFILMLREIIARKEEKN